jgi:type II secretion system protein G
MKTKRGFTLIELLVVIAIIGLLSSVVLASLNGARKKGRDARRLSDLKQLQTALELYYSDHTAYPIAGSQSSVTSALTDLVPTYISSISNDPLGGSYNYVYRSTADGGFYCLGSIMEGTAPASTCNETSLGASLSFAAGTAPANEYSVGP